MEGRGRRWIKTAQQRLSQLRVPSPHPSLFFSFASPSPPGHTLWTTCKHQSTKSYKLCKGSTLSNEMVRGFDCVNCCFHDNNILALQLLRSCQHFTARWLRSCFPRLSCCSIGFWRVMTPEFEQHAFNLLMEEATIQVNRLEILKFLKLKVRHRLGLLFGNVDLKAIILTISCCSSYLCERRHLRRPVTMHSFFWLIHLMSPLRPH